MDLIQAPATAMPQLPARFRRTMLKNTRLLLDEILANDAPIQRGDEIHAFHTLSYSLNLDDAWPIVRKILLTLAPRMEQAGFRDEWIPYLEKGITQSQRQQDTEAEAEMRLQLGIFFRLRGKYAEAHGQLDVSAECFAGLQDGYNEARVSNQIAYLFRLERNFAQAKNYAERAQEQLPENDDEAAYNHLVLGMIELDYDEPALAESLFLRAHNILVLSDNKRLFGRCLLNLGIAQRRQNRLQEAIASYEEAIIILALQADESLLARAHLNLGNVYLDLKTPSKSLELYIHAIHIFERLNEKLQLAYVNTNIGLAYQNLSEYADATSSYKKSIELFLEIRDYEGAVNALDSLGLAFKALRDSDAARKAFQKAQSLLSYLHSDPEYETWSTILDQRLEEL